MSEKPDKQKTIWRTEFARAWVKYWVPPARPTPSELKKTRELIVAYRKKHPDASVLILGSTSEYRDMMVELGIIPTIVDFSNENFRILSGAMKYRRVRQKLVIADWRTMRLGKKFDIILGEAAINVVPKPDWEKFLSSVTRHLKAGGLYIAKTWIRPSNTLPKITPALIRRWRKQIPKTNFLAIAKGALYLAVYDLRRDRAFMRDLYPFIKNLFHRGAITKSEWMAYHRLGTEHTPFSFVFPLRKDLERRYRHHFRIKAVRFCPYYLRQYHPLYVLTTK